MGGERLSFTIGDEAAGARLDRFLGERVGSHSRSALRRMILEGRVRIDGQPVTKPGRLLKPGSRVALELPDSPPVLPRPERIPVEVVHEDDHLIVVVHQQFCGLSHVVLFMNARVLLVHDKGQLLNIGLCEQVLARDKTHVLCGALLYHRHPRYVVLYKKLENSRSVAWSLYPDGVGYHDVRYLHIHSSVRVVVSKLGSTLISRPRVNGAVHAHHGYVPQRSPLDQGVCGILG